LVGFLFIFSGREGDVAESNPNPDLPEPSAELILMLALVQAYLEVLPPRKRARFLSAVDRNLGLNEAGYNVIRFRPPTQDMAVYRAMRQARGWWRHVLGALTWN
jgi:hypothetical protein